MRKIRIHIDNPVVPVTSVAALVMIYLGGAASVAWALLMIYRRGAASVAWCFADDLSPGSRQRGGSADDLSWGSRQRGVVLC